MLKGVWDRLDTQLKFLKILCRLYDGKSAVMESDIRHIWGNCPDHDSILNLGKDVYFDYNLDRVSPGYTPTPEGMNLVRERKRSNVLFFVSAVTLFVAVLTLAATLLQPLFQ